MNIYDVRAGLAANAQTADPDLNVYAGSPDSVTEPAFLIHRVEISYPVTFDRGGMDITVEARVLVSRTDDEASWERLGDYLSGTGSGSLRSAIESDQTLGGVAHDVTVDTATDGTYDHAGVPYLGAEIVIRVTGDGS